MNVLSKQIIEQLNDLYYLIYYDNDLNILDTIQEILNSCTEIHIIADKINGTNEFGEYFYKTIKLPKKKQISIKWVQNKLQITPSIINMRKLSDKICEAIKVDTYSIYGTQYGIGVFSLNKSEGHDSITKFLDYNNIEYRTEFSESEYVFRYIISKSKENLNKIKSL